MNAMTREKEIAEALSPLNSAIEHLQARIADYKRKNGPVSLETAELLEQKLAEVVEASQAIE